MRMPIRKLNGPLFGALDRVLSSLICVMVSLVAAALVMQASGYEALQACLALWEGATGIGPASEASSAHTVRVWSSGGLNIWTLSQSLSKFTPLILTGSSVAIALRAGLFNTGAQGQMVIGAFAVVAFDRFVNNTSNGALPAWVAVSLSLSFGATCGAMWGALAGWLRVARGISEVISTIMLNYVAANLSDFMIVSFLRDPSGYAIQSARISEVTHLQSLTPGTNLNWGILPAVASAVLIVCVCCKTRIGFEMTAVGAGVDAASAAGIPVARIRITALALSGALAGLAGAIEVQGVHHRYVQGLGSTYGFDGIAVALLGGSGFGIIPSALFFGALTNGATFMQLKTEVPASISVIIQATIILLIGLPAWHRRSLRSMQSTTPEGYSQ